VFRHSEHVQHCEQRSSLGQYEHVCRPSLLQSAMQHSQLPFQGMHRLPTEAQSYGSAYENHRHIYIFTLPLYNKDWLIFVCNQGTNTNEGSDRHIGQKMPIFLNLELRNSLHCTRNTNTPTYTQQQHTRTHKFPNLGYFYYESGLVSRGNLWGLLEWDFSQATCSTSCQTNSIDYEGKKQHESH